MLYFTAVVQKIVCCFVWVMKLIKQNADNFFIVLRFKPDLFQLDLVHEPNKSCKWTYISVTDHDITYPDTFVNMQRTHACSHTCSRTRILTNIYRIHKCAYAHKFGLRITQKVLKYLEYSFFFVY